MSKASALFAPVPIIPIAASTSVAVADSQTYALTGAGMTVTVAASTMDGVILTFFVFSTGAASAITFTGQTLDVGGTNAAGVTTCTFNASAGACLTVVGYRGRWHQLAANSVSGYT